MGEKTVGIVVGSKSDLEVAQKVTDQLDEFGIDYELTVCSAHKNPEKTADYAKTAESKGLKVIIAGAGLAAALPGVIASYTKLPVIGLPISSSPLSGIDSLYSIVQMPPGIPVATVGIDNPKNAAILAAEMLALSDETLQGKLEDFRNRLREK